MNYSKSKIFLIILLTLCGFGIIAGCTSSSTDTGASSRVITPVPAPTTLPAVPGNATPAPVTSLTTTALVTKNITVLPSPATTRHPTIPTPVPVVTKISSANDPLVDLNFSKMPVGISDCVMRQVFPEIAFDPDYGTTSGHKKLVGISDTKWNALYTDYLTGKNPGQSPAVYSSRCEGVPLSDSTTWDFAVISARLIPRNAKPSEYSIIISLTSNRKDIAQIITTETLTLDQPITISTWIPVRRTEIDSLGRPTISFNRLTNI